MLRYFSWGQPIPAPVVYGHDDCVTWSIQVMLRRDDGGYGYNTLKVLEDNLLSALQHYRNDPEDFALTRLNYTPPKGKKVKKNLGLPHVSLSELDLKI